MYSRRDLFTFLLDAADAVDVADVADTAPPRPDPAWLPPYLRPPGALPEEELVARCEHCGDCAAACPHGVILPLGSAYGDAHGTPAVLPRDGPCRLCEDLPCARACPSGALRPVPRGEIRMGTARLIAERCWSVQGQPCDYCVKECPLGESALHWDGDRPVVVEEVCAGCGMCVAICTATPPALEVS